MATLSYSTPLSSSFCFTFPVSFLPFFFPSSLFYLATFPCPGKSLAQFLFPSSLFHSSFYLYLGSSTSLCSPVANLFISCFLRFFPRKSDSAFSSFVNYVWLLTRIERRQLEPRGLPFGPRRLNTFPFSSLHLRSNFVPSSGFQTGNVCMLFPPHVPHSVFHFDVLHACMAHVIKENPTTRKLNNIGKLVQR